MYEETFANRIMRSEDGSLLSVAVNDGDEKAAEEILRRNSNNDFQVTAALKELFGEGA